VPENPVSAINAIHPGSPIKVILLLVLLGNLLSCGFAQKPSEKQESASQQFYNLGHHQLYWFSNARSLKKAAEWMDILESSEAMGIRQDKRLTANVRTSLLNRNALDGAYKETADRQITELVLNYIRELQEGNIRFDYNEISVARDSVYINELLYQKSRESPAMMVARLDCRDPDYLVLKNYLRDSILPGDSLIIKQIIVAMNYRRFLSMNKRPEYLLVNLPEAQAVYYQGGVPVLEMRTVVGRKKSPTPVIASYITSIVTFPHWNVPYKIAVSELLPKVQENENYLEQNNFEIVDSLGNPVDDEDLNWSKYTARNFPYFFRQATGAENSLGVLKFNIMNPFSIFLHSTSSPASFTRDFRFLSHGCIRLEKPFELADALLRGNIDLAELKNGKKDTESKVIRLPEIVQAFIIYSPVKVTAGKVVFLRDVYSLIQ
jgi:murein L,D-transpeptidase YcbB/YkuD